MTEKNKIQRGNLGADLLKFAGSFEEAELIKMSKAIEEGCEKVDPSEWSPTDFGTV